MPRPSAQPEASDPAPSGIRASTASGLSPIHRLQDRLVQRTALLNLLHGCSEPVIAIVAPPGYGKTTLLNQLSASLDRVARVACERAHNDPAALWRDIVSALDLLESSPSDVDALLAAGAGVDVVPRLVASLSEGRRPVTVILDHFEIVTRAEAVTSVAELAVRFPPGWRLVLASRDALPLPVPRLRVERAVLEIGVDELAMDVDEASTLLRRSGAHLPAADTDRLVRRTEGWPAGLYLAALAVQDGREAGALAFGGDDRLVDDYIRSELLARMSAEQTSFLLQTAILERLTGPLCDAVVGGTGSGRMLEELSRRNLLVVPLNRTGTWYRYHNLLRDMLLADLQRGDPDLLRLLHARASSWFDQHGMPEVAIAHARAAGDTERVAQLVLGAMQPVWASGRAETVLTWLEQLERDPPMPIHAAVAAHGSLMSALVGRAAEAEHLAALAQSLPGDGLLPDGSTVDSAVAYLRAILGRGGPSQMRADAAQAMAGLSQTSPYRATMVQTVAMSWLLEGDLERADAGLAEAYALSTAIPAPPLTALVLAERAILAADGGHLELAARRVRDALAIVEAGGLDTYWTSAIVFAVGARVAAQRGKRKAARGLLERAASLRPLLNPVLPVVSVQTLVEMSRGYLAISDFAGARAAIDQARSIQARHPHLGTLNAAVDRLDVMIERPAAPALVGLSSLTAAELRLLPLLPTHLSFPEIAAQLYVSRHTVKTQVGSIYRKLGVSSRGDAVNALHDLEVSPRA